MLPIVEASTRNPTPSNPNARGSARADALPALGIGVYRRRDTRLGIAVSNVFLFSESAWRDARQLGLGIGAGLEVFPIKDRVGFQFGLALGIDLYRDEALTYDGVERHYRNGLLINNDVFGCGPNAGGAFGQNGATCAARGYTWMLTIGIDIGRTR